MSAVLIDFTREREAVRIERAIDNARERMEHFGRMSLETANPDLARFYADISRDWCREVSDLSAMRSPETVARMEQSRGLR